MKDLEIFDKNGKALHIADVISRFIELKADEHKTRVNNIALCRRDESTITVDEISSVSGECVGTFEYYSSNDL